MSVSFPGYRSYKSAVRGSSQRGGTVVMVKNYLYDHIRNIDTSVEDQIWLQFRFAPKVMFGFCYIPPSYSQYYSNESFSSIQERMKVGEACEIFCIVGDLNARFGRFAREFPGLCGVPDSKLYSYPNIIDEVSVPNDNTYILSTICMVADPILVSNLKTPKMHYPSRLTYKKGNTWVSELDTCLVSSTMLSEVRQFSVIHSDCLPSDHAPVTLTKALPEIDLDQLSVRAHHLGNHAVLYNNTDHSNVKVKPVGIHCIDERLF